MLDQTEKGLLGDVLGIVRLTEHSTSQAIDPTLIASNELFKSSEVPASSLPEQVEVRITKAACSFSLSHGSRSHFAFSKPSFTRLSYPALRGRTS